MDRSEKKLENMCRACMSTSQIFHSICDSVSGMELTFCDIFATTIPQVPIHSDDDLPKDICLSCVNLLLTFHKFQQTCISSDTYMRSLLVSNRLRSAENMEDILMERDSMNLVKIKNEPANDTDFPEHTEEYLVENLHANNEGFHDLDKNREIRIGLKLEENDEEAKEYKFKNILLDRKRDTFQTAAEKFTENDQTADLESGKKRFKSSGKLNLNEHGGERHHKCAECNKTFSLKSNLRKHLRAHNGDKRHKCGNCTKTFLSRSSLKRHQHVHTGVKPYKCDHCGKAFGTSGILRGHKVTHGESRYICFECKKPFRSGYLLKIHERTHTGDRPYQCDDCEKSYTSADRLRRHKVVHTKPYKCDYCDKVFTESDLLNIHKSKHHAYKCDKCRKGFASGINLAIHDCTPTGVRSK